MCRTMPRAIVLDLVLGAVLVSVTSLTMARIIMTIVNKIWTRCRCSLYCGQMKRVICDE